MKKLLFLPLLFITATLWAQDLSLYQKKEYRYAEGKVLPYRILYPKGYDRTKKYPLVLFLHGAGERGNDNEKQLVHGSTLFLDTNNRRDFPAIILFPQCPENSYWSTVWIDRSKNPAIFDFNYDSSASWPLVAVQQLVRKVLKKEAADRKRCYVTGLSMGGMGTFELAYRFPKLFAAALPVCGGGDTIRYDKRVRKTAFWVFHGDADDVVSVNESRAMVNKLKSLHLDVKYTEYPGVNHNSWQNAFAEPSFLSWMFLHKRE